MKANPVRHTPGGVRGDIVAICCAEEMANQVVITFGINPGSPRRVERLEYYPMNNDSRTRPGQRGTDWPKPSCTLS